MRPTSANRLRLSNILFELGHFGWDGLFTHPHLPSCFFFTNGQSQICIMTGHHLVTLEQALQGSHFETFEGFLVSVFETTPFGAKVTQRGSPLDDVLE